MDSETTARFNKPVADRLQDAHRLEFEDADKRLDRLQALLESMNSSSGAKQAVKPMTFSFEKTIGPHAVDPPTELLSRVRNFLPQIQESNNLLLNGGDPNAMNIENAANDKEPYIEMNLGLGLFESKGDAPMSEAVAASHFSQGPSSSDTMPSSPLRTSARQSSGPGPVSLLYSDSDSDDSDSDSDAEIITSHVPSPRLMKPLPRRASNHSQTQ